MNTKLTITIILLLLIQVAVYFYVNKNEERINSIVKYDEVTETIEEEYPIEFNYANGVLNLTDRNINNLSFVPDFIWENASIHTVNLNNNSLTEFPHEVMNLPNLKRLYLNSNRIEKIDFEFIKTPNEKLADLEIAYNKLYDIQNVEKLSKLQFLNLSNNRINSTPKLRIASLKELNLQNNHIQYFNTRYIHENLEYLNLDKNYLNMFEVRNLNSSSYQLTSLYLQDNYITTFPNGVFKFPNLENLLISSKYLETWDFPRDLRYDSLKNLNFNAHSLTSLDFPINQAFPNLVTMSAEGASLIAIDIQHDKLEKLEILGLKNAKIRLKTQNLIQLKMPIEYLSQKSNLYVPKLKNLILITNGEEIITLEKVTEIQQQFPATKINFKTK